LVPNYFLKKNLVTLLQCLFTSLGKVFSHLLPQCKTLVFAFQFLEFWLVVFPMEQVSNELTAILAKPVWASFATLLLGKSTRFLDKKTVD